MTDVARPAVASPLPLRAALAALAGVLGVLAAAVAVVVVPLLLLPVGPTARPWLFVGAFVGGACLALLVVHVTLHRSGATWAALGFRAPGLRLLHLLWQVPVVLVLLVVVQVVFSAVVLGRSQPPASSGGSIDEALAGAGAAGIVLLVAGIVVLTPLWEEAVVRGLVHGGIRRRGGFVVAGLVSSATFAAMHPVPLLVPYYLAFGLSLAAVYEFHRTLWAPVLVHATVNAVATSTVVLTAL